ncbi:hypothetical protein IF1G_00129 [Cordyceps javanica]|uniref:Uncharacterized protein n=1 Tax=Cordyceps javanica TaxID=43265 RepID=A0A545WBP0_9HYPO|nr:hypothetical protein IF1G_00129 [Cordyceps javanica]TQW11400.1 hypothetical protein IF2G_00131 [Cordyceps javanica]
MAEHEFQSILYEKSEDGKVAYITLNRAQTPQRHRLTHAARDTRRRAASRPRFRRALHRAQGRRRRVPPGAMTWASLRRSALARRDGGQPGPVAGGYDPFRDYLAIARSARAANAELFHSHEPTTIAQVHGAAAAGGLRHCAELRPRRRRLSTARLEAQIGASQRLATVFDGITRNSPEVIAFQGLAAGNGFKAAVAAGDEPGRTPAYRKVWKSSL